MLSEHRMCVVWLLMSVEVFLYLSALFVCSDLYGTSFVSDLIYVFY